MAIKVQSFGGRDRVLSKDANNSESCYHLYPLNSHAGND